MADIKKIRDEIDKIDNSMIELFEKRMAISEDVAAYKRENNLPTLNSQREKEVIKKAENSLKNKKYIPYADQFFKCLMDLSKEYQKNINNTEISIGYQGIEGSFSYDACMSYIASNEKGLKYTVNSYDTFENLCLALLNDEISQAVIPFENSSTGPVIDVYDLLLSYNYNIVGEICVKVNHNLMAREGVELANIKELYSHSQAFMQSKEFLDNYSFKQIPYKNTAISAKFVSESGRDDIGCIASESAAKLYGLKILEHNINYNKNNYTKFIVLSKTPYIDESNNKISIITKLNNTPGQLFKLTKLFSDNDINMVKIESRPDISNPFEYLFFIDCIGNISDQNIVNALEKLKTANKFFKYLGNYKKYDF